MKIFDNIAHKAQKLTESSVKSALESVKESVDFSSCDRDSQRKKHSPKIQQRGTKSEDDSGWSASDIVDDLMDIF